jgi:hypothetical protein
MSNRTNEIEERLEQFRKSDSAILRAIAKRQERLDAKQNALRGRAMEQENAGELVGNNRRRMS